MMKIENIHGKLNGKRYEKQVMFVKLFIKHSSLFIKVECDEREEKILKIFNAGTEQMKHLQDFMKKYENLFTPTVDIHKQTTVTINDEVRKLFLNHDTIYNFIPCSI